MKSLRAALLFLSVLLAAPPAAAGLATISGTISARGGTLPAVTAAVALDPATYATVASAVADESGSYSLTVYAPASYIVIAVGFLEEKLGGYQLHGYFPKGVEVRVEGGTVRQDFALDPCYELVLEGYDAQGKPFRDADMAGLKFSAAMADEVAKGVFLSVQRGSEPPVPAAFLPPDEERRLFVPWTVPGVGRLVLWADNGGTGFRQDGGTGAILNLNWELARTQVARLRSNLARYSGQGYVFDPPFDARLAQAGRELDQADALVGAERAAWADKALATSLLALEEAELARARLDIARYRQGDLVLTVVDEGGKPVPGAKVTWRQTTHDFRFGVFGHYADLGEAGYALLRDAGINTVTSGVYWSDVEPREGNVRWSYLDETVGILPLAAMGFSQKAHPLIWFLKFAVPPWMAGRSLPEFDAAIDRRVRDLAARYRNVVDTWEVINEAHAAWASGGFTQDDVIGLTRTGIRAVRSTDPRGRISINAAFDWFGESKLSTYLVGPEDTYTLPVARYFDRLGAQRVDFDIVGQQLYNGGATYLWANYGVGPVGYSPTWDLAWLSAVMDRLQAYGKPVHLTEQEVSGRFDPEWTAAGWWRRPWDAATQAEFLTAYYTIGFSKPRNAAITWWDATDRNAFMEAGGLLDASLRPKPALDALKALVTGWTSSGSATSGADGVVPLRGYGGDYAVDVEAGPLSARVTLHVNEQREVRTALRLVRHEPLPPGAGDIDGVGKKGSVPR